MCKNKYTKEFCMKNESGKLVKCKHHFVIAQKILENNVSSLGDWE